jgi:hypothetical protein
MFYKLNDEAAFPFLSKNLTERIQQADHLPSPESTGLCHLAPPFTAGIPSVF